MVRIEDLLRRGDPNSPALVDRVGAVTYSQLSALVGQVAAGLARARVRPGDRVAVYLGKRVEAVATIFAASAVGAVFVPINPMLKSPQVAHVLSDCGAVLLVTDRPKKSQLDFAAAPVSILTVEDDWAALLDAPATALCSDPARNSLAALFYTSGSTGKPKGVMLTQRNLLLGAQSVAGYLGNSRKDRILAVLPLSFDYGFSQVTTAFHAGACAVLLDYLAPRDIVRACEAHRITGLPGVPPLWMQLADANWPETAVESLRYITNSGGRMPVALTRTLQAKFPAASIFLMYGLTEAFRSTYLDPKLVSERPESIGSAIPEAEVLVVRRDGSVTEDGEPGELVHAGPLVAAGYWRDEERTAERFRPAPPQSRYGGTAVWSGDTVVRGKDGLLTFVGRADDMIKTSGYRLSPTEVEEAAFATGLVSEAAAVGIEDEKLGQAVVMAVVARPGGGEVHEVHAGEAFRRKLQQALPSYMMPRRILWMDSLPRSPNGKIDRLALRETFTAQREGAG